MKFSTKIFICEECEGTDLGLSRRRGTDGILRCKPCSALHRKIWMKEYRALPKSRKAKQVADYNYVATVGGREARRRASRRYGQTEGGKAASLRATKKRYWLDPEYARMKTKAYVYDCEIDLLQQVLERDRSCAHCGIFENLCFDHVYPMSKGGKTTFWNLQILCRPCNSRKGNRVAS